MNKEEKKSLANIIVAEILEAHSKKIKEIQKSDEYVNIEQYLQEDLSQFSTLVELRDKYEQLYEELTAIKEETYNISRQLDVNIYRGASPKNLIDKYVYQQREDLLKKVPSLPSEKLLKDKVLLELSNVDYSPETVAKIVSKFV